MTCTIVAQGPPAPAKGEQGAPAGNPWSLLVMMALIFGVFYLLLIRPQRKKEKDRQKQREVMLSALKRNDHVVTIGGIHGVVASVGPDEVVIKVDERGDVRLRVAREAISRVVGEEGQAGDTATKLGQAGQ